MTETAAVPVGRLQGVQRNWEFQSGWVRAPLREIVFNDRLSKQARLVWLWLASVPPNAQVSWGECETLLRCGTKARRCCIAQLVSEGFISVLDSGIVLMHDPYKVFDTKRKEIIDSLREEWGDALSLNEYAEDKLTQRNIMIQEKKLDKELEKVQITPEPIKPKANISKTESKKDDSTIIVEAWNNCKPKSYTAMRRLSGKQKECIKKHLANLGLKQSQTTEFICTVCNGLNKSEFWSKTVAASGRNFNSVFGYGIPQDTKMKNIETLYALGAEEAQDTPAETNPNYTLEQQEIIDAYRYSRYNHENNRVRGLKEEADRWLAYLHDATNQLIELGVDINEL